MSSRGWQATAVAAWPRLLPRVVAVLLALVCVWLAVRLVWALVTQPEVSSAAQVTATAQPPSASLEIARWHLFGNGRRDQLHKQIVLARRETELKLTLHGTFAHADPRRGYALIADEHGAEQGYQVGDALPGGVKLAAVYADHVVLDNHGSMENLRLPRETLKRQPRARAPGAPGAGVAPATDRADAAVTPIFVAPRMVHGKVDWQRARAKLGANPQALLQQLQAQPVFDGTHMRGVRLGRSTPLLTKAGLQAGDLVTAVNGIALDSPARGQQLAQQLEGAGSVRVTLLRDGQPRTVVIDLR